MFYYYYYYYYYYVIRYSIPGPRFAWPLSRCESHRLRTILLLFIIYSYASKYNFQNSDLHVLIFKNNFPKFQFSKNFYFQNNFPKFHFLSLISRNSIFKIIFPNFQFFNLIFQNSILEIPIFQNSKFIYLFIYLFIYFEILFSNRFPKFPNLFF